MYLCLRPGRERDRGPAAHRRGVRGAMSTHDGGPACSTSSTASANCFDLRGGSVAFSGGGFHGDPYPPGTSSGRRGPVHDRAWSTSSPASRVRPCSTGCPYPEPSATSRPSRYAACDEAYRNDEVFVVVARARRPRGRQLGVMNSMLTMDGRRAPSLPRARPAVVRPGQGPVVDPQLDRRRPSTRLIDGFVDDGRAELNVDFCAAIPVLTITGSFGVPVEQALDIRAAVRNPDQVIEMIEPIVAARREDARGRPHQRAGAGGARRRGRRDPPAHRRRDLLVLASCCWPRARGRPGSRWASR